MSIFKEVQKAPPDPILSTALAFKADSHPNKVNLGIGAYRDNDGKPYVLKCVRKADSVIAARTTEGQEDKEYAPIDGKPGLKPLCQKLAFGKVDDRICSAQCLSGTGSLRVFGEFAVSRLKTKVIWLPDPTWGNHNAIFKSSGIEVRKYSYWDAENKNLDFDGMIQDLLLGANQGDAILLHAVAHNPTGIDPTQEQWQKILQVVKQLGLLPLIDNAYQGFASGDLEKDAYSVRLFHEAGLEFFVAQSFAKNMGLYGERFGMLHGVCADADRATAVLSQVKLVIRAMYSSPPIHGGQIVQCVLGDDTLYGEWVDEVKMMADQINEMRSELRSRIEALGAPGKWNHITDQIGMFSYTGLSEKQCCSMIDEHHIYMLKNGRISMAGVNKNNVQYIAKAIHSVVSQGDCAFADIVKAPPDAILSTSLAFKADTHPKKVNLGIGAYRDANAQPYVLQSVRKADSILAQLTQSGKEDKEYAPIDGKPALKPLCQKLLFGKVDDRIASAQCLSGTGSLRVFGEFAKTRLNTQVVWVPAPTWGNHAAIFKNSGLEVKQYSYWDAQNKNLNFQGMISDLKKNTKKGDAVLLHAVAHNPTGIDPTNDQWQQILQVVQDKGLMPLIDNAYQGFASGDLVKDAYSCRLFLDAGIEFFVAQSFAKNMGLYGERFGMLHGVCKTADHSAAVLSQVKLVIRGMYSSPPIHGAQIVQCVLGDDALYQEWAQEVQMMANQIDSMRKELRSGIEALKTPGTWNHITDQIGMFSYTGLNAQQCCAMIDEHHIYMLKNGRISMAGVNSNNVQYIASAINDVVLRDQASGGGYPARQ